MVFLRGVHWLGGVATRFRNLSRFPARFRFRERFQISVLRMRHIHPQEKKISTAENSCENKWKSHFFKIKGDSLAIDKKRKKSIPKILFPSTLHLGISYSLRPSAFVHSWWIIKQRWGRVSLPCLHLFSSLNKYLYLPCLPRLPFL